MAFAITEEGPVAVLRFDGDVEGPELVAGMQAAAQSRQPHWLFDLAGVRTLGLSPEELEALHATRKGIAGMLPGGRAALLMRQQDLGIGTLYAFLVARDAQVKHRTVRAFTDRAAARAWLAELPQDG